jgi:outer membrane protein TolC
MLQRYALGPAAGHPDHALDVLVAEDAAYQALLHRATAIVNYNQAQANLLAALGLIDQFNVVGPLGIRRATNRK